MFLRSKHWRLLLFIYYVIAEETKSMTVTSECCLLSQRRPSIRRNLLRDRIHAGCFREANDLPFRNGIRLLVAHILFFSSMSWNFLNSWKGYEIIKWPVMYLSDFYLFKKRIAQTFLHHTNNIEC